MIIQRRVSVILFALLLGAIIPARAQAPVLPVPEGVCSDLTLRDALSLELELELELQFIETRSGLVAAIEYLFEKRLARTMAGQQPQYPPAIMALRNREAIIFDALRNILNDSDTEGNVIFKLTSNFIATYSDVLFDVRRLWQLRNSCNGLIDAARVLDEDKDSSRLALVIGYTRENSTQAFRISRLVLRPYEAQPLSPSGVPAAEPTR